MKLNIQKLKEGENPFEFSSDKDSWLKDLLLRLKDDTHEVKGALRVELKVVQSHPDYYLHGKLEFCADLTCGRCAESFLRPLEQLIQISLAQVDKRDEVELNEEGRALDVVFFEGNEIELNEILEEQFQLSFPYQFICEEGCKGICQSCGQNLNHNTCECTDKTSHSGLARLGVLKP